MSGPPAVRLTRRDESGAMSPVLADAFVDEAGLNYWLKQGREKERARRKFFDAIVEDAVHPERDLYVAESDGEWLGGALWLRPGQKAFDLSFALRVGRDRLGGAKSGGRHPRHLRLGLQTPAFTSRPGLG